MNESEQVRAEALFKSHEAAKAEFEAELRAQRDKTARLRALRLARDEARWLGRRPKAMAGIKDGLVALREKTAQMLARRPTRNGAKVG
jgi:hypothetical protein